MDTSKLRNYIITSLVTIIITSICNRYASIEDNDKSLLISKEKVEQLEKRITKLEEDSSKLNDIYVTRREFTVVVDNLNTTLKRVDDNVLKLTEKFYEKVVETK